MALRWDHRFLRLAREVASWSKDPGTKVGSVIVRPDRTVVSMGYNGFPRRMPDEFLFEQYHLDNEEKKVAFREEKLARTIHAEMNAILTAKEPLAGCVLYCWPFLCCERCFVHIVQAGIVQVVAPIADPEKYARWQPAFERVRKYADEIRRWNASKSITITEVYFDDGD